MNLQIFVWTARRGSFPNLPAIRRRPETHPHLLSYYEVDKKELLARIACVDDTAGLARHDVRYGTCLHCCSACVQFGIRCVVRIACVTASVIATDVLTDSTGMHHTLEFSQKMMHHAP